MRASTIPIGAEAERVAEAAMVRTGYTILERNWRGGGAEIDRIAWHGSTLVFVEIRSRDQGSSGDPSETVGISKQRKVLCGALAFLADWPSSIPDVRFDVISVLAGGVTIIVDAFDASALGAAFLV
ncbi:MAG: YraN family protein [Deltaproteobacteria bacterium]|nr:YraN family protein [Deltaproteobacteria bacterium]